MRLTERLYYDNATLCKFTAHVLEYRQIEKGMAVRLDRTAFYPTSGGQPHDVGTLDGMPVVDVWDEEDGAIWHLLGSAPDTDAMPQTVTGEVTWARRFDHMQQHTGQHLLSAAFSERFDAATVGFHLGSESSTIDLTMPKLSWKKAHQIEDEVNKLIWEDHPVQTRFFKPQELAPIPLRKAPKSAYIQQENIRVVSVEGYDYSACGGTHVSRTGEIGIIKITGIERYKGGVRVTFLCGERAMRDYQRVLQLLRQASLSLTVGQDELPEAIARLQEEATTIRRSLNKAQAELLTIEAQGLWSEAPKVDGVHRIVAYWERPFSEVQELAKTLRENPRTLALMAANDGRGVRLVCARSDDLKNTNAGAIIRIATGALGGRGGGSPTLAQGGAQAQPREVVLAALEQALN